MKYPKFHLIRPGKTACGLSLQAVNAYFTDTPDQVTCKTCIAGMTGKPKEPKSEPTLEELKRDLDEKYRLARQLRLGILRLQKIMPNAWEAFRRAHELYDTKKGIASVYPSILSKTP